jgi:predicted DNA-binding protein
MKTVRKDLRLTEQTKNRLEWLAEQLGMTESAVIDLTINEKYLMMKKETITMKIIECNDLMFEVPKEVDDIIYDGNEYLVIMADGKSKNYNINDLKHIYNIKPVPGGYYSDKAWSDLYT